MIYPWKRKLIVRFNVNGRQVQYDNLSPDCLDISVRGSKYLVAYQDTCNIDIVNLPYEEIFQYTTTGAPISVQVICGYENTGTFTIFNGGVLYVSNDIGSLSDRRTTAHFICSSRLASVFANKTLTLTMNGGLNLYNAYEYITNKYGVKADIDTYFKGLNKSVENLETTTGDVLSSLRNISGDDLVVRDAGDGSYDTSITSITSVINGNKSSIPLTTDKVVYKDYPLMSNDGLRFSILPTMFLRPADVIKVPNMLINTAVSSIDEALKFVNLQLSSTQEYVIKNVSYNLSSREGSFTMTINARSKELYKKALSGSL